VKERIVSKSVCPKTASVDVEGVEFSGSVAAHALSPFHHIENTNLIEFGVNTRCVTRMYW
jgi:hypothetical protein